MTDQFDDDSQKQPSDFAKLFEASMARADRTLSVGDKIKGEILVVGKEDVFVSTGTRHDGIVLRRDLVNKEGEMPFKKGDVLDLSVTQVRGAEIFLSPKATAKNLSEDLEDAFDMMLPVEGKVMEICKGGFRVSVLGKTAFCPISQIDLKFVEAAEDYLGKRLEFRITQFSGGGKNIVVSRRKLLEEEREVNQGSFMDEHKPGEILNGTVTRLERFGAFVELTPGVEGLVHISELSWSRIDNPSSVVQPGQEIVVKLLKIETDAKGLKISLSLKQASEDGASSDPWSQAALKFPAGTVVRGKVEKREIYGLFVRLDDGIVGLLPKSVAQEKPDFHYDKFKKGDDIAVQVAEVKQQERRISLQVPTEQESDEWKSYSAPSAGTFGTLGDQLKGLLDKKKPGSS